MGDAIEFNDVVQEVRGAMQPGRLKLQSDNIIFRNLKTGKTEQFAGSDIKTTQWLIRARGYCLKITLINGTIHRFDGLRESEYEKLSGFVSKNYNTTLDKIDLALKGWNWGTAKFKANALDFVVGHHTAFEIPLTNVSHCAQGKNEVTLEFHQNDDAAVSLMELRFHIPSDPSSESDPVNEFYKNVIAKADIIQATGDAIAIFQEVQCLTPRGRYDIKLYPTFLQLHGKTFDYKIPYTTILRLFLLPHRDGRQMFFVVSLDPPIKQGQTRYPFLILLFNKDDETTLDITLDEEEMQEKYDGKLQKEMSGPEYEIISRVMKTLVQRKITVPGSFTGMSGSQCVSCSYKAATGHLYPLERGFIFVHKPPLHIRFDEISGVNFARSSGSTRSFDFEIDTKAGTTFTFSGMEKDEYGKLYDFVTNKKLRVKNISKHKGGPSYDDDLGDSDDDHHDAYLQRVKREAAERDSDDGADGSDSDDEDFVAGSSGSEVAEEYDSEVETSTDTDDRNSDEDEEERKDRKNRERESKLEKKVAKREKKRPKAEGGAKKRRAGGKKKKDPNAPKKPLTAYFLWLNDNRERLKKSRPDAGVAEIAKLGGEGWKSISDSEKAEYQAKHEEAKKKYEVQMKEYLANKPQSESDEETSSPKKKKAKRPSGSPSKDTKAGSGANYKSKEFISDVESSSDSDDDSDEDAPLKPKGKSKDTAKSPKGKKGKKDEDDEFAGLPSDEEILSDPTSSSGEESD